MPSLLRKLKHFDPETGRTLVQAADGFHWKEGKKAPEDSKVTKLLAQHGWQLTSGSDVWLNFKKRGNPGEMFIIRGEKRWYLDMPDDPIEKSTAEGVGLASLAKALETGALDRKPNRAVHASPTSTAVNNAGKGHGEVDGDPLPEKRIAKREVMHDDSGAQTGLRSRPDYGESDSVTSKLNDANAKGASILVLVGHGGKTASGSAADMYVTAVTYEKKNAFKLASIEIGHRASDALVFPRHTAASFSRQIAGFYGAKVRLKQAGESTLNGFPVMSLEDFVGDQGESKAAAAPAPVRVPNVGVGTLPLGPEIERDRPATLGKPKEDENNFGLGAKHRELSEEEMQQYMGRIMDWKNEESKDKNKGKKKTPEQKERTEQRLLQKKKDKFNLPILHSGNIHIVDDAGEEYDTEKLKKQIMERPSSLLKKNEKMKHSDGTATQFYNIGLPALKGLAVNEKTGKFVVVDTCPGAGACKLQCYAMRGSYVQYPATSMGQSKILNFLVNHPDKFKARLKAEINVAITDVEDGEKVVVRWHDAGDFFSPQYMEMAFDVARAFPDVEFYAYTKVANVANSKKPDNFIINFSEGALPSETKRVDLTQIKKSVIVPQKMFWDLIVTKGAHVLKNKKGQVEFKSDKTWDEFRDRLAQTYQAPKDAIIIYDDYIKMKQEGELGDKPKWNVVVPPGAGDQAANDPLVLVSFLMWH